MTSEREFRSLPPRPVWFRALEQSHGNLTATRFPFPLAATTDWERDHRTHRGRNHLSELSPKPEAGFLREIVNDSGAEERSSQHGRRRGRSGVRSHERRSAAAARVAIEPNAGWQKKLPGIPASRNYVECRDFASSMDGDSCACLLHRDAVDASLHEENVFLHHSHRRLLEDPVACITRVISTSCSPGQLLPQRWLESLCS
jgi:hypothetical protein